jgi:hypothetical protein
VSAKLRRAAVEVGVDVYNALNRTYADASDLYISNFSREPGQQRASLAIHSSAAPPTSALASLTLYL